MARRGLALPFLLGTLAIVGIVLSLSFPAGGHVSVHGTAVPSASAQNSSSGSDPPGSSSSIVCPSAGPVILGVEWDCVAVLNLTEIALILVSIAIVAYVFKDSDKAELPGDSAQVPVTAEEWEVYRAMRQQGRSRWPPKPENGEEDR
jgi:hypothetical protein